MLWTNRNNGMFFFFSIIVKIVKIRKNVFFAKYLRLPVVGTSRRVRDVKGNMFSKKDWNPQFLCSEQIEKMECSFLAF